MKTLVIMNNQNSLPNEISTFIRKTIPTITYSFKHSNLKPHFGGLPEAPQETLLKISSFDVKALMLCLMQMRSRALLSPVHVSGKDASGVQVLPSQKSESKTEVKVLRVTEMEKV